MDKCGVYEANNRSSIKESNYGMHCFHGCLVCHTYLICWLAINVTSGFVVWNDSIFVKFTAIGLSLRFSTIYFASTCLNRIAFIGVILTALSVSSSQMVPIAVVQAAEPTVHAFLCQEKLADSGHSPFGSSALLFDEWRISISFLGLLDIPFRWRWSSAFATSEAAEAVIFSSSAVVGVFPTVSL